MQQKNEKIVSSPSNLVRFVQSPFASWMERFCIETPEARGLKDNPDALLIYPASKGIAYESA
jgi:uncharacterized protein